MAMKLGMCGFTIGAAAYFKQFPVVEVQQTFYDPPPIGTLEKWRRQAPAGFEFTMKAWQVITHLGESPTYRRLRRPMLLVHVCCRHEDEPEGQIRATTDVLGSRRRDRPRDRRGDPVLECHAG